MVEMEEQPFGSGGYGGRLGAALRRLWMEEEFLRARSSPPYIGNLLLIQGL
jgi:hypothetical protein